MNEQKLIAFLQESIKAEIYNEHVMLVDDKTHSALKFYETHGTRIKSIIVEWRDIRMKKIAPHFEQYLEFPHLNQCLMPEEKIVVEEIKKRVYESREKHPLLNELKRLGEKYGPM